MELRVLRYFLAVAREKNITAAAELLHVTQPTLSKQLMDLESELGKKLFIRGSRKITLTEEGLYLCKRAQEIVDLADKTEAEFNKEDEMLGGSIYIGGGETGAMRYAAAAIKQIRKIYPDIQFHLYSGNGEDVMERLDKGLVDFGLFVGTAGFNKYDYLRLPMSDTWGLLLRKDNPIALHPTITPELLKEIPLICSRQSLIQNELSGWLGCDFSKLKIAGTYNLIYNASLMVEEGIGAALCIDGLIHTDGSSLCFRPLEPPISAGLVIAWKKHQVFSKAAEIFLKELQHEISMP